MHCRNRSYHGDPAKGKPAFVGAVVPEQVLGLNPILKNKKRREPKNKANEVTLKHKRWLAEFASRRQDELASEEQVRSTFNELSSAQITGADCI